MGGDLEERVEVPRLATTKVCAIALSVATTCFARPSAADARPEPIDWTYSAPPECPPAAGFEREFRARTTRAELVTGAADASRSFAVTLSSESGRAVGRIKIDGPAGATATRVIAGQTCSGVVSALALVAALAVDPLAGQPAPVAPQPARPAARPAPVTAPNEGAHAGRKSLPHTVVAAGLDADVMLGLFPKPAPSASIFGEVRLERGSLLAPSARLSLSG